MDLTFPKHVWEIRKLPRWPEKPPDPPPNEWIGIGWCWVVKRPANKAVGRPVDHYFVFPVGDRVNPKPIALRYTWDEICDLLGVWPMEKPPEPKPASTPSKKGPAVPIEQWEAQKPLRHRGKDLPQPPAEQLGWWDAMLNDER